MPLAQFGDADRICYDPTERRAITNTPDNAEENAFIFRPAQMPLTIPELIEKLSKIDQSAQVAMFVDHRLVPIHEVIHMPSTPHVFLAEKPHSQAQAEYTDSENGLIGYCAANSVKDEVIASLLGRPTDAVTRQRKRLGF